LIANFVYSFSILVCTRFIPIKITESPKASQMFWASNIIVYKLKKLSNRSLLALSPD